jgi:hypothetical protein
MSATMVFDDIEQAFTATALPTLLYVRVGGHVVDATEATVRFGVDQPVGTCTVYVQAPRPAVVALNATIEIEMGYPGASARRFIGFIPSDESITDERGKFVRIDGVGWASRLTYPEYAGIELAGPISLKDAFRSLCALRSIPTYLADDTTATDGATELVLGGNEAITAGNIRIDADTAPLTWLQRMPPAFGYRVFDSPDGAVRLARVSGLAHPEFASEELTTELTHGDYVVPRTTTNFREAPDTSSDVITGVTVDDLGRVISDEQVSADGFVWMQFTFAGLGAGWCAIASGSTPNFFRQEPVTVPVLYEEGVNGLRFTRVRDIRDMATYIEVKGARFTADDGGTTEIRSIPDDVPYSAELDPPGYRKLRVSLQDLVTEQQAQWARNATEVDRAAPYELLTWEYAGRVDLQPGDVVTIHAPTHDVTFEDYWLMSIDESTNERGYLATYTGWRGAGQALRAGNDCRTETVPGDSVIHAGTQSISWYRDPSPDSVRDPRESDKDASDRRWVVELPITVTDADYSSLRLTGKCHGTNSINNATAITGSKVEIWQLADPSLPESGSNESKRVGSMDLPTTDEERSKRRTYASSDQFWTAFSLPISGQLKVGAATLVIVCGEEEDEVDDFELKDLRLTYCGVGEPALPGSVGT